MRVRIIDQLLLRPQMHHIGSVKRVLDHYHHHHHRHPHLHHHPHHDFLRNGYNRSLACQCNSLCPQYNNCCSDYNQLCAGAFISNNNKNNNNNKNVSASNTTTPSPSVTLQLGPVTNLAELGCDKQYRFLHNKIDIVINFISL